MATADWPTNFYTHDAAAQDQDLTQDEWNRVALNVEALTRYLGLSPQGNDASVAARLARHDAAFATFGKVAMRNLRVYNNVTTPNTKVDITFAALALYVAGQLSLVENQTITVDLTVQGKNGRDGSWARPTGTPIWTYLYVIQNPTTGEVAGVISQSNSVPDLTHASNSGFTLYRRVCAIWIDSTNPGNFRTILQQDNRVQYYDVPQASRIPLSAGRATTFTTIGSMAALVPPTSVEVDFAIDSSTTVAGYVLYVSPYAGLTNGMQIYTCATAGSPLERYIVHRFIHCPAQTLYYKWSTDPGAGGGANFIVNGYIDPVG